MLLEEDKLDDSWIHNFNKIDKPYEEFYKENVYYVHLNIVYVNIENEIIKVSNEIFFMRNPNIISKEEIIDIIKRNSCIVNNVYSLVSIIQYNINLEPKDIEDFLNNGENYLTIIKHIDEIHFEKTISMFQDLNSLLLIFYEKDKSQCNKSNVDNYTKKIYLKKNSKKTQITKHNKTIRNV